MEFLTSALAFIFAIAVLVAIHEYGHYWMAKKLGVKVLRYSIGFGKPLWKAVRGPDKTEYVVAAIPLGGFVKMLDEREGDVDVSEKHRAFNNQPVGSRIAIVAAGPLANFLFAIVAYALMYMAGVNGIKPMVGSVIPGSVAAEANIPANSEILSVDGVKTPTWESASLTLINKGLKQGQVQITLLDDAGFEELRTLDLSDAAKLLGEGNPLANIGIVPWRPKLEPVLKDVKKESPAAQAGLQPGDQVISLDGTEIREWEDLVSVVRAHPGITMEAVVLRDGKNVHVELTPEAIREADGNQVGRIGVTPEIDREGLENVQVTVRYGPLESLLRGVGRTWDMSVLTLRVMGRMVIGQASLSNVSGPLTIAEFAGMSALIGVSAFLSFLALVSVSLGVLNLLPVPVLDGGHLLFYLIEMVRGAPLSETVEAIGQRIGLALIGGLMVLAFYNDITRLLN